MNMLQTFVVGRATNRPSSHPLADVLLPASEDTVGRRHVEITLGEKGSIYLVDLNSANGTFVLVEGKWKKIHQSAVTWEQPLRLGEYETTVAQLAAQRAPHPAPQGAPLVPPPLHLTPPPLPPTPPPLPSWSPSANAHPKPESKPRPGPGSNAQGRPRRRNPATGEVE